MSASAPSPAAGRALSALRRAGRVALDLLLPPHCLTCDSPVGAPGQFCPACFARTGFVTAPLCDSCGVPFEAAGQGGLAGTCADSGSIRRPGARRGLRCATTTRPGAS